jgi:uncharacterized damage-inducible protein DinB
VSERTGGFAWSNMFLKPDEDPRSDGGFTGERATLVGYLRDQRLTMELKCSGLTPEQLATRSVPPSTMSLLGLIRHMADVELGWFRRHLAGLDTPYHYRVEGDRDRCWTGAVADPELVERAWADWRAEVAFSERFVADAPDLDLMSRADGEKSALREVLVHMIEEYARHNGHADLLRERIDGKIGQ